VSVCNSRHCRHNFQRKHHTSLCTNSQWSGTLDSEQSIQPLTPQQNLTMQNQPSISANTIPVNSAFLSVTAPQLQNAVCLLKIAVATVNNGTNHTKANLLFDEGSQRSFITEALAKILALQPQRKEDITISSFGAQYQFNQQVNVAVINLVTLNG